MTSVTDKSSTVSPPNRTGRQSDDAEHNQHVIHQQTIVSAPSIDVSSLTSICLAVLVVSNVFFTILFYCAWKKRQKMWQQQLNRPLNSRQQPSFVDHVPTKEEVNKWDLSTKRDPEEESLYDSIQPESMDTYWDIDYVQLRKVVRDKFSTLTTLFKTHSYDVENTVSKLTPKEPNK